MTVYQIALSKLKQTGKEELGASLTPAEILALISKGYRPTSIYLDMREWAIQEQTKGRSNPRWVYFKKK